MMLEMDLGCWMPGSVLYDWMSGGNVLHYLLRTYQSYRRQWVSAAPVVIAIEFSSLRRPVGLRRCHIDMALCVEENKHNSIRSWHDGTFQAFILSSKPVHTWSVYAPSLAASANIELYYSENSGRG